MQLKHDLESIVTLTVQILDAARSGNPVLLEQSTLHRDLVLHRLETSLQNSHHLDEVLRLKAADSISMVQGLDEEIKGLVAYQYSKTKRDLKFLETLKKELLVESSSQKGQRLKARG